MLCDELLERVKCARVHARALLSDINYRSSRRESVEILPAPEVNATTHRRRENVLKMSGLIRYRSLTPAYSPSKNPGSSKQWSDAGVKQFTSHRNAFQVADIAAYLPERCVEKSQRQDHFFNGTSYRRRENAYNMSSSGVPPQTKRPQTALSTPAFIREIA